MNFDNLNTDGGKLVVILGTIVWLTLVGVFLVLTKHTPQETTRALLTGAFSSMVTLLIQKLGGKVQ
jgi:hypothetical protein